MKLKKINDAAQKAHPLAIDLFLIMIVALNIFWVHNTPQYEIIPEEYLEEIGDYTFTSYEAQTNNPLITPQEAKRIEQENRAFKNKLTLFGTIIFILYAITQYSRWKQKTRSWKNK